jgi:hypothetical protein
VLDGRVCGRVRLRATTVFRTPGSLVVRCEVLEAPREIGPSVIVKKVREDRPVYAPESAEFHNAAHSHFADWAAATVLAGVAGEPRLAPVLHAGSRSMGFSCSKTSATASNRTQLTPFWAATTRRRRPYEPEEPE